MSSKGFSFNRPLTGAHRLSCGDNKYKIDPSSPPSISNRFYESRMNQFNQQPPYPDSKVKKALRKTGYVASLGIYYLIRQNKKKKKISSVCSLDSMTTTNSCMSIESLHEDTTNLDDEISQLK